MKTKINTLQPKRNVNIITLGCSKNTVDSEVLMGQLSNNGFGVQHEAQNKKNDIVIINTCGFIDNAKQESIDTILKFAELKEKGKVGELYVTGCLSERYKHELEAEINGVNAYFGTSNLPDLLATLGADYKHELIGERFLTTPSHYAYFKVSEGCNRPCSFCAIPLMRGKHVSKSLEDLVKEAKFLAKNGTKELILIAQDLTYYGLDIYNKRALADLLNQLSDVEGIEWIRLQYAYPSQFPMEILPLMRDRKNICTYLDMPLQHISDAMLKSMRRGITKRRTIELVSQIRDFLPEIAIRTTLIAGYPGETDQDAEELMQFVEETRFERLGVFAYSHEEKTHAHSLIDDVPEEIKEQRIADIMEIQEGISMEKNNNKIGKTFKVLFDRKEGDYFIGRTEHDSPEVDNEVLVKADANYIRIGDFANIKIERAEAFDLYGVIA